MIDERRPHHPRTPVRWHATLLLAALVLATTARAGAAPVAAQDSGIGGWTPLATDGSEPGPRWDHTLAADEAGGRLVLFGGRDGEGTPLGDTWLFDLAAGIWEQAAGAGPEPRFGHAVAVDQEARALYLFGGQAGAAFYNDVWRFDLEEGAWSRLETDAGAAPAPRYGTSAVLDGEGHLLVSHGFTDAGRFDDTWSLDLATNAWTDVSPAAGETRPLKRCLHEAVWDAAGERMLLFGGCASGFGPCPLGDLWAFDPAGQSWSDLTSAAGPAPRSNPALAVDLGNERALLVAGSTDAGYAFDLWTLPLGGEEVAWEELGAGGEAPSPRASHDAVVAGDRLYLFGGFGDAGALADLWALDLGKP